MVMPHTPTPCLPPTWARTSSVDSPLILVFDSVSSFAPRQWFHFCPLSLPIRIWGPSRGGWGPSQLPLQRAQSWTAALALLVSGDLVESKLLMSSAAKGEVGGGR